MLENSITLSILEQARKRVIHYALKRPETPALSVVSLLLTAASLTGILPYALWPLWPAIGLCGIAVMIWGASRTQHYVQRFATDVFYARFDAAKLALPELQSGMREVLEVHRKIFAVFSKQTYTPLSQLAGDVDEWVIQIYGVSAHMDTFVSNGHIAAQIQIHTQASANADAAQRMVTATHALITLDPETVPTDAQNRQLLWRVKDAVTLTKTALDDSLNLLTVLHQTLQRAPELQISRDELQNTRAQIEARRSSLSQADALLQSLFRDYTVVETIEASVREPEPAL
jgi:hypothetical protein